MRLDPTARNPSGRPLTPLSRDTAWDAVGRHGTAGPDAHLMVMETNSTMSGLEPLLSIEALAEYLLSTSRKPAGRREAPCAECAYCPIWNLELVERCPR